MVINNVAILNFGYIYNYIIIIIFTNINRGVGNRIPVPNTDPLK